MHRLKKSSVQFAWLTAVLLVSLSAPTEAQDREPWISPNLSSYSELPIAVKVGLRIDQIIHVDQKSESFGAVGDLRVEWRDPNLAFDPLPNELQFRRYEEGVFGQKADEENIFFPSFTIYNQQGRRFRDEAGVVVLPDGKAVYLERFSVTLQAPDFDFAQYPFDVQRFFVSIDTQWPQTIMRFLADPEFSGLGDRLGEEEWVFRGEQVELTAHQNLLGSVASRITFVFSAHRHIWYYVLRIFVPLVLIVFISWIAFFLKDFSKRVDISAGNLLVYVAFNFTISNDLPRLGYMTFMDTILAAAFVITCLAVVLNVFLRRLEVADKEHIARRIDAYTLWIYPSVFTLSVYLAFHHFFPS